MTELTVPEMRETALKYVLYESTRRAIKQEPELASLTDAQLRDLIDDLLNAGRNKWTKKFQGLQPGIDADAKPLDCEGVEHSPSRDMRGKTKLS